MDFRVVGRGGKAHNACRRVRGDWGKCAHITTYKGQREWHLFMSLASLKPKSGKKSSIEETHYNNKGKGG